MGIAYELKFFKDDSREVLPLAERAERLLNLRGQYFYLSRQAPLAEQPKRKANTHKKIEDQHDFFLHLKNDDGEKTTAITLDSPFWSRHFEEPECFSVIGFGAIKHLLWQADFASKFGPAFAEFVIAVSRAFEANRSYLYDDSSLYWRLNAHMIYYRPAELYRADVERVQAEWLRGIPSLGVTTEALKEDNCLGNFRTEKEQLWQQLDAWATQKSSADLEARLQDVDYLLDEDSNTLVLLGFPDVLKGYIEPFFLK